MSNPSSRKKIFWSGFRFFPILRKKFFQVVYFIRRNSFKYLFDPVIWIDAVKVAGFYQRIKSWLPSVLLHGFRLTNSFFELLLYRTYPIFYGLLSMHSWPSVVYTQGFAPPLITKQLPLPITMEGKIFGNSAIIHLFIFFKTGTDSSCLKARTHQHTNLQTVAVKR